MLLLYAVVGNGAKEKRAYEYIKGLVKLLNWWLSSLFT